MQSAYQASFTTSVKRTYMQDLPQNKQSSLPTLNVMESMVHPSTQSDELLPSTTSHSNLNVQNLSRNFTFSAPKYHELASVLCKQHKTSHVWAVWLDSHSFKHLVHGCCPYQLSSMASFLLPRWGSASPSEAAFPTESSNASRNEATVNLSAIVTTRTKVQIPKTDAYYTYPDCKICKEKNASKVQQQTSWMVGI